MRHGWFVRQDYRGQWQVMGKRGGGKRGNVVGTSERENEREGEKSGRGIGAISDDSLVLLGSYFVFFRAS